MNRFSTSVVCGLSCLLFFINMSAQAADISNSSPKYQQSKLHKFHINKSDFKKNQERLLPLINSKTIYRDKVLISIKNNVLEKLPKDLYDKLKIKDEMNLLKIKGIVIDTTKQPANNSYLPIAKEAGQLRIIQFIGPPKSEWLKQISQKLEIINYVNNNAYLIWGTKSNFKRTLQESTLAKVIQWNSFYEPTYKIDPDIDVKSDKTIKIDVSFYNNKEYPSPINRESISKFSAKVFSTDKQRNNRSRVRLKIPAKNILDLANLPEVINIVRYFSPSLGGERQAQIISNNLIYDASATPVCNDGSGNCVPSSPGYLPWLSAAPRDFNVNQFAPAGNPDFFVVDFGDTGIDLGSTVSASLHNVFKDALGNSRLNYVQHMTCVGAVCNFDTSEGIMVANDPNDDNSDPYEHGTLVASIIAGHYQDSDTATNDPAHESLSNYGYGMGIAPFVHIGSTRVFDIDNPAAPPSNIVAVYQDETSLDDWFDNAYSNNARISSNSWSNSTSPTGKYDSFSEQIDNLVRDSSPTSGNQEMVIVFLAGNKVGVNINLWDQGATAKNAIVVGGSENVDSITGGCLQATSSQYADDAMDVLINSSAGPTLDGRFKPDLVAPASRITGARTQTTSTFHDPACPETTSGDAVDGMTLGGSSAPSYIRRLGTSFATPAVAGAAALLRQWFINKKNSGNSIDASFTAPSPAMTKAWLMNTTTYMTGDRGSDNLPSNTQGMGRLNIDRAFNTVPRITRDQLTILNAGDSDYILKGNTGLASEPFRVTLAWTDAPGVGSDTGTQLKNNLDLTVCTGTTDENCTGGTLYNGNNFLLDESQSGGSADLLNNVESIWLSSLAANTPFTIRVKATTITSDGVPGNPSLADQDFSVVAYNATLQTPPATSGLGTVNEDSPNNDLSAAALLNTPIDNTGFTIILPVSSTAGSVSVVGGQLLFDASGFDSLGPNGPPGSATITYTVTDGYGASFTQTADVTIMGENDSVSGVPLITGSQVEHQPLAVDTSGINDLDGRTENPNFNYQWLRNNVDIATNGSASTYILVDADVGTSIKVRVSYTDDGGTTETATSFPTSLITNVNDMATGAPAINGTTTEDQTLTANTSAIIDNDGLGSFNFQWKRDDINIGGAITNTYTLGDDDVGNNITVTVSFIDGGGTTESVTSLGTGAIANINDDPDGLPVINGSTTKGQILTASTSGITDADGLGLGVFTYQWFRNSVAIPTATNNTHLLENADVGTMISVTVGYTDGQGTTESITSNETLAITNFNTAAVGVPTISGSPTENETLTAITTSITDADGLGAFSFQWLRNNAPIMGETNNTILLNDPDVGTTIKVIVSYIDGGGTNEMISSTPTALVMNLNDLPINSPTITGIATEDEMLTVETGLINDEDGLGSFSYQWLRDNVVIGSATNSTFVLNDADVGTMINVTVSYTDLHGTLESINSAAVGPILNVNDLPISDDNFIYIIEAAAASHTFIESEFPFIFDADGDVLNQIRITNINIPLGSTLQLSGSNVANNTIVTAAQISNLVFTPAAGASAGNNYANFNFEVHDGTGFSTPANIITISIIPSVAHDPLDVVIVTDTSGSMNGTSAGSGTPISKMELLKLSVNNFIDQWSLLSVPNDRIGLVLFSTNPEPYTDLGSVMLNASNTNMQAIGNHVCDVDPLNADTCDRTGSGLTAMGGGIQEAINALRAGNPNENNNQNIIVFTDGMQNRTPMVVQTAPDADGDTYEIAGDVNKLGNYNDNEAPKTLRVHTIGTGVINTSSWQTILAGISSETSISASNQAFHAFHMDASSDLPSDWIDSLIAALNTNTLQKISQQKGTITRDSKFISHKFSLNKTASRVNFSVMWLGEKKLDALQFILRKGRKIITVTPSNRNIQIIRKDSHTIANAIFPVKADDGTMISPAGDWEIIIKSDSKKTLDYNMWVIADDSGIKYEFIPPASVLAVGDRLPIQIRLLEGKRPLNKRVSATVSIQSPTMSEGSFLSINKVDRKKLAKFKVPYRPKLTLAEKKGYYLLRNKELAKRYLSPKQQTLTLFDDGNYKKNGDREANDGIFSALSPVIKIPGIYRLNVRIKADRGKQGSVERIFNASSYFAFKNIDKKNSKFMIDKIKHTKATHKATFTPIDRFGNYMGPGHARDIKTNLPKNIVIKAITDNLDGSYTILIKNKLWSPTNIRLNIGKIELKKSIPAKLLWWRN